MISRQKKLRWLMLVLLLWSFAIPYPGSASPTASLTVTAPGASGVVLPELDEFATNVMGDPWDMNEPTDLAFYRSESSLANSTFANGVYSAQMTAGDGRERIALLTAGTANNEAMRVGKIGYNYPINAGTYRYLTFRMYKSNDQCNSGLIQWYADDSYASASMGVSNLFPVPPPPCTARWHIYVLDLQTIGIQLGGKNWTGTIRELLLHPFAGSGAAGATVKLDWARLTAADPRTARPYTIQWTGNGSGGSVTLYARPANTRPTTPHTGEDIVIASNLSASGGSYVFQTGVLPAGKYYIAASNSNGDAWSSGPLIINAPPRVTITKPSMTSGQDYAETEIGNAWDMNQSNDLNDHVPPPLYTCVTNESYSGGIYSAVVPVPCPSGASGTDPILYLGGMNRYPPGTLDPTVDTNKYRYLSYRYYQAGTQDVGHGWISRFGWWQVNATDNGVNEPPAMSNDIIVLEGWNNYKIDLWADDVVDETYPPSTPGWQSSHPNRLRFDPTEMLVSTGLTSVNIQLDWIKLTAMDEVARGKIFPIQYDLTASGPATLTFYYDTDTDPSNGRTLIGTKTSSFSEVQATNHSDISAKLAGINLTGDLTQTVFLPLVMSDFFDCTGNCYSWNTTSVPAGTYYICIQSQDAYNTLYQCSEAPVVVK
jgi:hypothetical protein